MGLLEGQVAVITGGTRGLGLATAQAFAREGAAVVVASRSPEAVERTVLLLQQEGAHASGLSCDVGDLDQVKALAQHALDTQGRLDIWMNNAGLTGPYGPTAHIDPSDFVRVVQTNILGVYHGSWVALQHFLPQGHGKLINVLGAGDRRPAPMQSAYGSSKAWVRQFTQALAREYRGSGVGIFALNPGLMHTDLVYDVAAVAGFERRLEPFKTVLRMWAESPDVPARRVVWLASAATDGRTGLEVHVLRLPRLLHGALQELWRRLLRRPGPSVEIHIRTIPPALSDPTA